MFWSKMLNDLECDVVCSILEFSTAPSIQLPKKDFPPTVFSLMMIHPNPQKGNEGFSANLRLPAPPKY